MKMTQQQVDEWNDWFPPGTECLLLGNYGEAIKTKTRSIAWLLGHGQPVVKVEGKSGGWELDRIKILKSIKLEESK